MLGLSLELGETGGFRYAQLRIPTSTPSGEYRGMYYCCNYKLIGASCGQYRTASTECCGVGYGTSPITLSDIGCRRNNFEFSKWLRRFFATYMKH
jgi:hypothetical protein